MPTRTILPALLCSVAGLVALAGCGSRPLTVSYTYQKEHVSQSQLLEDERTLKHTKGVTQVLSHLDDKDAAHIELILDQRHPDAGLRQVQDLGYTQVRN
jgi:hypothetical protein